MVVAITYDKETGNVGQHFGHADFFKLYEIENGRIMDSAVVALLDRNMKQWQVPWMIIRYLWSSVRTSVTEPCRHFPPMALPCVRM